MTKKLLKDLKLWASRWWWVPSNQLMLEEEVMMSARDPQQELQKDEEVYQKDDFVFFIEYAISLINLMKRGRILLSRYSFLWSNLYIFFNILKFIRNRFFLRWTIIRVRLCLFSFHKFLCLPFIYSSHQIHISLLSRYIKLRFISLHLL